MIVFLKKIKFLGFVIDEVGMTSKANAIMKMPVQANSTQVKSGCGSIYYYGLFLSNLSSILKPI